MATYTMEHNDVNRFYALLFGWRVQGALAAPRVTMFAEVSDFEEHLTLAQELGGTIVTPPRELPGSGASFAFVRDPEGQVFGLVKGLPKPGDDCEAWSIVQRMVDGTRRQRAEYEARTATSTPGERSANFIP